MFLVMKSRLKSQIEIDFKSSYGEKQKIRCSKICKYRF
jgi:hypothetical protein